LLASSAVDFDDLLLHVAQLLYKNPELRAELDRQYRYVLVDEYQDTNRAQYVILRALSVNHPNLAATGDPDQSIYGWRGADLNNILEFEKDFPQVKVVRLERNYRSTKRILRIADELISHNVRRKAKSLFTSNDEGTPVRLNSYLDQDQEATDIASQIRQSIDDGMRRASDFAVFYRINALSRTVERALRLQAIPYQIVRGQEFYQRREIRDVLAYCQLANNPRDDVAFERCINAPTRGIGKKTLERLSDHAYSHGIPLLDAAREVKGIEGIGNRFQKQLLSFVALVGKIAEVSHGSVEEVIGTVLSLSGYRESLEQAEEEEGENRLANIEELLTDARQFDEQPENGVGLEDYLERTWLVNETDDWENETDKVTLMTLHAAKGLEFPSVFVIAFEDGILPHDRSLSDPNQLEEERRLAFVGITRAKEELQLSHVRQRDFRGQRRVAVPSGFLLEMPRDEMERLDGGDELAFEPWATEGSCDDEEHVQLDEQDDATEFAEHPVESASIRNMTGVTTAAALAGVETSSVPRVSPEVFTRGMTVVHPDHGPGKIIALSGSGKNRRATIQFATAGQKKFVLAYSPLRPVGA
jgi:DNA helicase-2/ATP-dependent DNA helicase PcrA